MAARVREDPEMQAHRLKAATSALTRGAAAVRRELRRTKGSVFRGAIEEERDDLVKMRDLLRRSHRITGVLDETDAAALRRARDDAITREGREAFLEAAEAIEEEL